MDINQNEDFSFTSILFPNNINSAIVITGTDLEKYVKYINQNRIEQAYISGVQNLKFLIDCPTIKYIKIMGATDYSPLYELKQIKYLSINNFNATNNQVFDIDLAKINGLVVLSTVYNKGIKNLDKLTSLKSLYISNVDVNFFEQISKLVNIDTLRIISGGIKTLSGIEKLNQLQCLNLYNIRNLKDISSIKYLKNSLKLLRIQSCGKIEDFSAIEELKHLVLLELSGSNQIDSIKFINSLTALKTFIFDINILDGDLTPCNKLSYVASLKGRKHYSHKDKELPKGNYISGTDEIEIWRRIE